MKEYGEVKYFKLGNFITEYTERNLNNEFCPVAVGRYGIRTRESIYSKELAKDYSKNKLIFKDTLTVGMGSVQIDIGILTDDLTYSVSPAYHTYKINGINSDYLRYCMKCRNQDMFQRYVKRGSRQGKTIDLKLWLNYEIPVYNNATQEEIVHILGKAESVIALRQQQLQKLDELVKARFVEMFEQGKYDMIEFGGICYFLRNGASIKQNRGAAGIPITRIETLSNDIFNIDKLGYADIFELGKYESYRLQKGDILISHINSVAYLGRAVQYKDQLGDKPIIHGMNLLCARIKESFNPTYVEFFFKTPMAKDYITTITKKAVNQASITTSDLKKMMLPVPPLAIQNQFADFVQQVDKVKATVQKALDEAQVLFDALMQKYFG